MSSSAASGGICDCCSSEEERPRYVPAYDPSYGFHRTGWRPWNPEQLHWHPNVSQPVSGPTNSGPEPTPSLAPAPTPIMPHWIPQPTAPPPSLVPPQPSLESQQFPAMPQSPMTRPPLSEDSAAEIPSTPPPLPTSQFEREARPVVGKLPMLFVGHSTLKPPKPATQPNAVPSQANPYGDYRQTQP